MAFEEIETQVKQITSEKNTDFSSEKEKKEDSKKRIVINLKDCRKRTPFGNKNVNLFEKANLEVKISNILTDSNNILLDSLKSDSNNIILDNNLSVLNERIRRGASIKAIAKYQKSKEIEKRIDKRIDKIEDSNFCGIKQKRVRINTNKLLNANSILSGESKKEFKKEEFNKEQCKFFLEDLEFLKIRSSKNKNRRYSKARSRNTKKNEGYSTVIPIKKVLVEVSTPREMTMDLPERVKSIRFDLKNNTNSNSNNNSNTFNSNNNSNSNNTSNTNNTNSNTKKTILLDQSILPNFKWDKIKQNVEIIHKINLYDDSKYLEEFLTEEINKE